MKERFSVFVNDRRVEVYRGMKVRHALVAAGSELLGVCESGQAAVHDGEGFITGLDGALEEGMRFYVELREKR